MSLRELSRRSRSDIIRAWAITRKDIRIYYFKPPVVIFGILMPVFLFLAFMVRRNLEASALIPGLMAMTVFFGSSTVVSATIPWERAQQTYDRLLVAPISLYSVLLGKALAGLVFGVLVSIVPLLIGILAFDMVVRQWWLLPPALVLSACAFSSLGVLLASMPGRTVGDYMMLGNLIRLPLIFVSGIFIPLEDLPRWGTTIAFLSPLTYSNNLMQQGVVGSAYLSTSLSFILLVAFWGGFFLAAVKVHSLSKKQ